MYGEPKPCAEGTCAGNVAAMVRSGDRSTHMKIAGGVGSGLLSGGLSE